MTMFNQQLPTYAKINSVDGVQESVVKSQAITNSSKERSTSLRYSVFLMLTLFAFIIIIGIGQRTEDMEVYQKYYDSTIISGVSDISKRMAPMIKGLNSIKETQITKYNKKNKRKKTKTINETEELPEPDDLTNTEAVWDFLFDNSDDDLILYSPSMSTMDKADDDDLNIITLLIKKIKNERADEWLVQLALWFHEVALHWPKDIVLDDIAIKEVELLLKGEDFTGIDETTDSQAKEIIKQNGPDIENAEKESDTDPDKEDLEHIKDIEEKISILIDNKNIQGKVAIDKLKKAKKSKISLTAWRKLLFFVVSVSEAAPAFKEYLIEWEKTSFKKVQDVVYDNNKEHKREQMQVSAGLLEILENECEENPRTSKLIRASFLKILDDEEEAEKKEKADKENSKIEKGKKNLR